MISGSVYLSANNTKTTGQILIKVRLKCSLNFRECCGLLTSFENWIFRSIYIKIKEKLIETVNNIT